MSKIKIISSVVVFGLLAIGGYFFIVNQKPNEPKIEAKEKSVAVKKAGVDIQLSQLEEKNWQIETQLPKQETMLPLGSFIGVVDTPQNRKTTLSFPMNITIKELFVQKGDSVNIGDVLAKASSVEWIEAQNSLINASLIKEEQSAITSRKQLLCDEGIIAKNECKNESSQLRIKSSQISMAKSMLKNYGASDAQISYILNHSQIIPSFDIRSEVSGIISEANVTAGMSVEALREILKIQKMGEVWIETKIEESKTKLLQKGDEIVVRFANEEFNASIDYISNEIDTHNQTKTIKLLVPQDINLIAGFKDKLHLSIPYTLVKIPKIAVTTIDKKEVVFAKVDGGYRVIVLDVISSDDDFVYVKNEISTPIAINSVVILKNILESSND